MTVEKLAGILTIEDVNALEKLLDSMWERSNGKAGDIKATPEEVDKYNSLRQDQFTDFENAKYSLESTYLFYSTDRQHDERIKSVPLPFPD